MHCNLTLELTETLEADVCVWFNCTFPGCAATHYDPPEPPEFEITDIEVETLYGATYEKTGRELMDAEWYNTVHNKAEEALEAYDEVYDHQLDAYNEDRY
jgi:hypothetical protein